VPSVKKFFYPKKYIMPIEDEISKLKTEVEKLKESKKDGWDKLQVLSSLLIPIVLAIFVWIQNANTEFARESSADLQLKLDSLQNEREIAITTINSKVGQVNLVSNFFEALLSTNESRKKLAIKSVLIALPEEGPDLVRIVSSSENQDGIKSYAEKSLDERSNKLIKEMYSVEKSERLKGFDDLYSGWKNNSDIIPKLIEYAQKNDTNTNGIINTLTFLNLMDKSSLTPYSKELNAFSHQFEALGPKIKEQGEKLRSRLT
jgi:hypothetical protein